MSSIESKFETFHEDSSRQVYQNRICWEYLKVDNNWFESPYVCPMVYSLRPLDGDFPPNIEDVLDANFDLLFNAVLALVYMKVAGTDK